MVEHDGNNDSSSYTDSENSESDCNCDEFNCDCIKTAKFDSINVSNIKLPNHCAKNGPKRTQQPLIEEIKQTDTDRNIIKTKNIQ